MRFCVVVLEFESFVEGGKGGNGGDIIIKVAEGT